MTSQQAATRPADHWRQMVAERAVPQSIRDQAPEREWSLEPERFRWRPDDDRARRRLYVGPERDAEIAELLRSQGSDEHRATALWWPGTAPS